ncbi:MAG: hypothetical protein QM764_10095 [Chitinophagaceae bacterium]
MKFLKVLIIVVTVIAIIAILTKPSSQKCYTEVETALKATQHQISLYIEHDKDGNKKPMSSITVKDKFFYKEVYFFELGKNTKVAYGAFMKVFLITNPS